jgi:hypothetical protein
MCDVMISRKTVTNATLVHTILCNVSRKLQSQEEIGQNLLR